MVGTSANWDDFLMGVFWTVLESIDDGLLQRTQKLTNFSSTGGILCFAIRLEGSFNAVLHDRSGYRYRDSSNQILLLVGPKLPEINVR